MARLVLAAVVLALLAGCTSQKLPLSSSFDAEQARLMLREGTGSIRGSALWRQRAGGVVTCAGFETNLVPVTRYAEERIALLYGNTQRGIREVSALRPVPSFTPDIAEYNRLLRTVTCDAQGFFEFDRVGPGEYFVVSQVTWEVPNTTFIPNSQGGILMQRVKVTEAEDVRIVLSP